MSHVHLLGCPTLYPGSIPCRASGLVQIERRSYSTLQGTAISSPAISTWRTPEQSLILDKESMDLRCRSYRDTQGSGSILHNISDTRSELCTCLYGTSGGLSQYQAVCLVDQRFHAGTLNQPPELYRSHRQRQCLHGERSIFQGNFRLHYGYTA